MKITKQYPFSKVGLNEVEGLEKSLRKLAEPILQAIKSKIYWNDSLDFQQSEYTSRDGFIPYSHNCGGLELSLVIPSCESYEFGFLEFGECDPEYCTCHTGTNPECELGIDGHLDAKLRVWLKFEGIEDGVMSFYFYLGGGNGDAPYFRTEHETTVAEYSFQAMSLRELEHRGATYVRKMLKVIGAK